MKLTHIVLYDLGLSLGNLIAYLYTGNKGNVIASIIILIFAIIILIMEIVK